MTPDERASFHLWSFPFLQPHVGLDRSTKQKARDFSRAFAFLAEART